MIKKLFDIILGSDEKRKIRKQLAEIEEMLISSPEPPEQELSEDEDLRIFINKETGKSRLVFYERN